MYRKIFLSKWFVESSLSLMILRHFIREVCPGCRRCSSVLSLVVKLANKYLEENKWVPFRILIFDHSLPASIMAWMPKTSTCSQLSENLPASKLLGMSSKKLSQVTVNVAFIVPAPSLTSLFCKGHKKGGKQYRNNCCVPKLRNRKSQQQRHPFLVSRQSKRLTFKPN